MASERSSLLSVQRKYQQQQQQRRRRQQHNHNLNHLPPRHGHAHEGAPPNPPISPPPLDLLTDSNININDNGNNVTGEETVSDSSINRFKNNDHDNFSSEANLIDINFDDDRGNGGVGANSEVLQVQDGTYTSKEVNAALQVPLSNQSQSSSIQQLQARARIRNHTKAIKEKSVSGKGNDHGYTSHENDIQLDILNSFDEDDEDGDDGGIKTMKAYGVNVTDTSSATLIPMDGIAPESGNHGNGNNTFQAFNKMFPTQGQNTQNPRSATSSNKSHQSPKKYYAKKAISTLFGTSFATDTSTCTDDTNHLHNNDGALASPSAAFDNNREHKYYHKELNDERVPAETYKTELEYGISLANTNNMIINHVKNDVSAGVTVSTDNHSFAPVLPHTNVNTNTRINIDRDPSNYATHQQSSTYPIKHNQNIVQDLLSGDNDGTITNIYNNSNTNSNVNLKTKNTAPSLLDQVEVNSTIHSTPNRSNLMDTHHETIRVIKSPLHISSSTQDETTEMLMSLPQSAPSLTSRLSKSQMQKQQQIHHQNHYYAPNRLSKLSDEVQSSFSMSSNYYSNEHNSNRMTQRNAVTNNNNTVNNNNNNNMNSARSWFGGNLNSTLGANLPVSSEGDSAKNHNMHIVGSEHQDQRMLFKNEQTLLSTSTTTTSNVREHQQHQRRYEKNNNPMNDTFQMTSTSMKQTQDDWNWLNTSLFLSYGFTAAANVVPIALIPTIAMEVLQSEVGNDDANNNDDEEDVNLEKILVTKFASTVATYAVLGSAMGKFLNGSLGDIFGARRIACYFSLMHSFALLMLSFCRSGWSVICCCVAVEYYQSVMWPCIAVILAAHYGNGILGDDNDNSGVFHTGKKNDDHAENQYEQELESSNADGRYEKGIYIASLGSRGGSLVASLASTMLLRYVGLEWRGVARLATMGSFIGSIIFYLFVTDSPGKLHDPQNPIKENMPEWNILSRFNRRRYQNKVTTLRDVFRAFLDIYKLVSVVFLRNILPSLRSVLSNGTFWVVAIAHSGGSMVCSSIRILGTYFHDTSYGTISENQAGVVTLFLSVGVLVGLFFGGNVFSELANNPRARKSMISRLYIMTVAMCYSLAFLAIPFVRSAINSPYTVAFLQAIATFFMGAGVAVQVFCIPAIVGCTFGANKGLYASYTDGVACIVSSMVWRIMGNAVEEGNPQGSGWAYGWAAVALLVVLAGFLMVEFVEHYFCRGGWIGRLRDAKRRAGEDNDVSRDFSFSDDSSVSKLAESGKRMWEKFRPISRRKEPDMNSILSMEDDDDDISTILFEDISSKITFEHYDEENDTNDSGGSNEQRIAKLLKRGGNEFCVDCRAPLPRWVSIIAPRKNMERNISLGVFCCSECAGSHRKLGTHIAFVRSIDHDSFKKEEIKALENGGNTYVNTFYEALLSNSDPCKIGPSSSLMKREIFIAVKYEEKKWFKYSNRIENESLIEIGPEIELVKGLSSPSKNNSFNRPSPSSVTDANQSSVFDQAAPVDQNTIAQYESFVRNGNDDSESEYSDRHGGGLGGDAASVSSEESNAWHISHGGNNGLDVYVDL